MTETVIHFSYLIWFVNFSVSYLLTPAHFSSKTVQAGLIPIEIQVIFRQILPLMLPK
jgi:hypothetical protein